MENGYYVDLGCFAAYVIATVTLNAMGFRGGPAVLALLALAHLASMVFLLADASGQVIVARTSFIVMAFVSVAAGMVFVAYAVALIAGALSNG